MLFRVRSTWVQLGISSEVYKQLLDLLSIYAISQILSSSLESPFRAVNPKLAIQLPCSVVPFLHCVQCSRSHGGRTEKDRKAVVSGTLIPLKVWEDSTSLEL